MKLLVVFILLLSFNGTAMAKGNFVSRGQFINKEWIGPGGEYLHATDDTLFMVVPNDNEKPAFRLSDSFLVLTYSYVNNRGLMTRNDTFVVGRLNDDTLVLRFLKDPAKKSFISGVRDPLRTGLPVTFVNRAILNDPNFTFQKIFYSFSGGMTQCQSNQVSVDSSGLVLFAAPTGCDKFNGTYKGHISAAQVIQLSELVKNSLPERFVMTYGWADGGQATFKYYYDHKVKEITGQGCTYLAYNLQKFLSGLAGTIPLEKVSDATMLDK